MAQLLEYKKYKYVAGELRDRMEEAGQAFYRAQDLPESVRSFRPEVDTKELLQGVTLEELHRVFQEVLKRQEDKIDPRPQPVWQYREG